MGASKSPSAFLNLRSEGLLPSNVDNQDGYQNPASSVVGVLAFVNTTASNSSGSVAL